MTFRALSLGLLATLMLGGRLAAAELGDPAPPLQISEWVKGQPVDLAEGKGKRIHVIAFWATTYGPIRTSIAFLTELQRKFKDQDVVIVGICKDKPDVARKFVDQMGDKMDYTVAIDKGRATGDGYMKAFGANTIPHAFVVDKEGKFAWQGHPMGDLEVTLQEMLAGKHTLERAKQRARGRTLLEEYFRMVQQNQSGPKVDETVKELTGLGQAGLLPEGKPFDPAQTQRRVRFQALSNEYRQALMADADAAKLDALARELGDVAPPEFKLEEFRETQLLQLWFVRYMERIAHSQDGAGAREVGEKLLSVAEKRPELLIEVASQILTDKRVKHRDIPFALKLAKAACEGNDYKSCQMVSIYARALSEAGQPAEAVARQKQAIELAPEAERAALTATLREYEAKLAKP